MSKLVFAVVVLVVGLTLQRVLRRQAERLPGGLRTILPSLVGLLAVGVPVAIVFFSILRIIPAGQVGVQGSLRPGRPHHAPGGPQPRLEPAL